MLKFTRFCNFQRALGKISAHNYTQAFEAGDFLNIFLTRFWNFGGFSYKHFSYKKYVFV